MEDELTLEDYSTSELLHEILQRDVDDPIKVIKSVLKLQDWQDKDRIIEEIKNL